MTSDVIVAAEQGRPAGSGIVRSLKGGQGGSGIQSVTSNQALNTRRTRVPGIRYLVFVGP